MKSLITKYTQQKHLTLKNKLIHNTVKQIGWFNQYIAYTDHSMQPESKHNTVLIIILSYGIEGLQMTMILFKQSLSVLTFCNYFD